MKGIPPLPLVLGLLGFIPFFAPPAVLALGPIEWAAFADRAFTIYAAVILSFLGGARWGLEIARAPESPNSLRLIGTMLPSIAAWATALAPGIEDWRAQIFAGLYAAQYVWDRSSGPSGLAPAWYPLLRGILTVGVLAACLAMAAI